MKAIRFSPGAFADLDDIFSFYERKETGLGEYFRSRINEDIEGLILTAGIHRKTFKDYHRLLSRVFPHAVYYTVTESEIIVWAVVDCRRHPDWISDRLSR
jgi:plasmid stabilization system protein ParE